MMNENLESNESKQPSYEEWLALASLGATRPTDYDLTSSSTKAKNEEWTEEELLLAENISFLVNKNSAGLAETALPLIGLHLFNYSRENKNADEQQILYELGKIKKFSDMEKEYGDESNPLPTVGFELEIPQARASKEMRGVLNSLRVNNERDPTGMLEINPRYSYSPWVAGKLLQEVSKAGYIRNVTKIGQEPVAGDLSLHLSFGVPKGLEATKRLVGMQRITDLFTYAFVSPERIENRKTNTSLMVKKEHTEESKKFKDEKNSTDDKQTLSPYRVEIRPTEFRGKSSFRMIAEAQLIMGLYFSQLKKDEEREIPEVEKMLSQIYLKFDDEIRNLFAEYKLNPRQYDKNNKSEAIITMEPIREEQLKPFSDEVFVEKCRSLITEYARKASLTIKDQMSKRSKI